MYKVRMKKRLKMSKFEKLLYSFAVLLLVFAPVVVVFSKATLSKVNFDVEDIKKEIGYQAKKNESLNMKINELASLDKIEEVAKEKGLSYNNDNIKTIQEQEDK